MDKFMGRSQVGSVARNRKCASRLQLQRQADGPAPVRRIAVQAARNGGVQLAMPGQQIGGTHVEGDQAATVPGTRDLRRGHFDKAAPALVPLLAHHHAEDAAV